MVMVMITLPPLNSPSQLHHDVGVYSPLDKENLNHAPTCAHTSVDNL